MAAESSEVRFVKLQLAIESEAKRTDNLISRIEILEDDKTEQIGILARLGQTVENLAVTVSALADLTKDLDKNQAEFTAKFNIIIGILSTIGIALIAGVIKILFFPGVVGV